MDDSTKIVKFLEVFGWLIKGVIETNRNQAKEYKDGFLSKIRASQDF